MSSGWKVFSHTADIGLEAWGKTRSELFRNAALGMLSILTDPSDFKPAKKVSFSLKAGNPEDLLVAWLEEILYFFTVKRIGFHDLKIASLTSTTLCGTGIGGKINIKRHRVDREIKAVTYHDLKINETKNGFRTRIIFDI